MRTDRCSVTTCLVKNKEPLLLFDQHKNLNLKKLINNRLTLNLPMSYIYIYMELLVKPEILTYIYIYYIYGPMFGNAESRTFLIAAQGFNIELMQIVFLCQSCV
jgi:hypothetical protein